MMLSSSHHNHTMDQRKKKAQAVFAKLQAQKANKTCIDCGAYNPQWASVNNSCFFCIKCAGTHRSLGVHLSFVRSVGMDSWSDVQLEAMKAGGNEQLLKFWEDQGFPSSLPSQEKYDNDAMEAYRAYIKARSKGQSASFPKNIGYKKRVRKAPVRKMNSLGSSTQNVRMEGRGNSHYVRKPVNQDDFFAELTGSIGTMTSSIGSSVGSGLSKLAEKSQTVDTDQLKNNIASGWNNFSSWASSTMSNLKDNLQDLADNQEDNGLSFKNHLRQNLGSSSRKMASLGNTPVRNGARKTLGTGKKMPALGSDQFFGRDQEDDSPPRRQSDLVSKSRASAPKSKPRGKKVSRNVQSPPATKKKYGGMSSDTFFEEEDKNKLDEFYGSKNNGEDDLDDFGSSDDDEEEEEDVKTTRQVLGKISVADDDDDDIDIDD